MPSGDCSVALCLSLSALHLSCKVVGKILAMWKIPKCKKMSLATELIPVNAKLKNCFLSLAKLGKTSSVTSAINAFFKFDYISVLTSE